MATYFQFPFGPGQASDNLTGLGAGQAKVLGSVGDGSLIYDIIVAPIQFMTGAGAVGTVELWLALSENGGATGNWSAGINPTSLSDQSAALSSPQIRQVASINVGSSTIYKFDWFSASGFLGGFPMFLCLLVRNNTNVAFNATASNFAANYSRQNFSSPLPLVYA